MGTGEQIVCDAIVRQLDFDGAGFRGWDAVDIFRNAHAVQGRNIELLRSQNNVSPN
jgi:hypothetical protein